MAWHKLQYTYEIKTWKKSGLKSTVFHIYIRIFHHLQLWLMNSEHGQLPAGMIAQLEEHCTGIAEVMGSNTIQYWIFFLGFNFTAT